jgi:hypothetical protein
MLRNIGILILILLLFANCKKKNDVLDTKITILVLNEFTKEPLANAIVEVDIVKNYSWGILARNEKLFDLKTDSHGLITFNIKKGSIYYLWFEKEQVRFSELIKTENLDLSSPITVYFRFDFQKIQL